MMQKKKWAFALGCATCCAPLVLPALMGGTGVLLGGWISGETLLCALPVLGLGLWAFRRRRADTACNCAEECKPACKQM